MPTLTVTKNWDDNTTLTEAQLDDIKNSIETWANTTKLDSTNIQSGGISADNIASSAVTTAKINANAVTRAKLEAVGQQVSSSSGTDSITASSYTDVTNLSVSITTTGRPVVAQLIGSGSATAFVGLVGTEGAVQLLRGATTVDEQSIAVNSSGRYPPGSFQFFDTPGAGTYTYKIQGKVVVGTSVDFYNLKLVVREL
jgi:hypothetical protein